jgi:hypothetical protein
MRDECLVVIHNVMIAVENKITVRNMVDDRLHRYGENIEKVIFL